jgi:hypothetical protein
VSRRHLTVFAILAVLCGGVSAQVAIPNHKDTVTAARKAYAGLPAGRLRAYCIVNRTAWDLRLDGVGLFYKTGDNGYAGRSSDVVIYKPRGETFDILGDAEGAAVPQWGRTKPTGFGDVAMWRAPQDPATVTVCGAVAPPPDPDPTPTPDLTPRVEALERQVSALLVAVRDLQAALAANGEADAALAQRVTALEQAPSGKPCTVQQVATSRSLGHTHHVQTCLP